MQEVASEALERLDQHGLVISDDPRFTGLERTWFWGAAMRIAGGTDEILKNIIAERVLGLPLDIRVDRDVAFKDLPQGRVTRRPATERTRLRRWPGGRRG